MLLCNATSCLLEQMASLVLMERKLSRLDLGSFDLSMTSKEIHLLLSLMLDLGLKIIGSKSGGDYPKLIWSNIIVKDQVFDCRIASTLILQRK